MTPDRAKGGSASKLTPEPAPKLIMDAQGRYWRVYPEHFSIPPTSTDNDPIPKPWVEYVPALTPADREAIARKAKQALDGEEYSVTEMAHDLIRLARHPVWQEAERAAVELERIAE